LRISIDFNNDLGWFRLPFRYTKNGFEYEQEISFEVFPSKMDMQKDLDGIYKLLDEQAPLLRFAVSNSTEQSFQHSRFPHKPFELLWLAEFRALNDRLKQGYQQILNAPHNRLLPGLVNFKAERLIGKIPNKLAEKARADIKAGLLNRRYALDQKRLSVDTPENRFVKASLSVITNRLDRMAQKIALIDHKKKGNEKENRFSNAFYDQLNGLKIPYQKFSSYPLWKEVGAFSGLKSESLVLQQKTGYSAVYQAWQQLKYYLDVLGQDASISTKSIADLYEVWCFLNLAEIIKQLGFKQTGASLQLVELDKDKQGLEYRFNSGSNNVFKFEYGDAHNKIEIELTHEFSIGQKNKNPSTETQNPYIAWMAEHKPDIFMRVRFADGREYVWLFDAKYRIDLDSHDKDWVPVDALAQMHRYRDAIIYRHQEETAIRHSRPVYGAYALYPGYFPDQESEPNPYDEAIDEIDIGAFPFLPGIDNVWLKSFLKLRLGLGACSQNSFDHSNLKSVAIQLRNYSVPLLSD
jgi:hypothetical protein